QGISLPLLSGHPGMNFAAPVVTTAINPSSNLVGFQGDLTFDERVVTFQNDPVQKAGLTAGNWNVAGNVLEGPGPIRTLRVSAYATDLTPLSGAGTLFELNIVKVNRGNTQLNWTASPETFYFIDANLNTERPGNTLPGTVTRRTAK